MFGGDKIEVISNCTDSTADVSTTFLFHEGGAVVCFVNMWACFYSTNDFVVMGSTYQYAKNRVPCISSMEKQQNSNYCYFTCLSSPMPGGPSGAQNTHACKINAPVDWRAAQVTVTAMYGL